MKQAKLLYFCRDFVNPVLPPIKPRIGVKETRKTNCYDLQAQFSWMCLADVKLPNGYN
jgi:hypothetical protein